MRREPINKGPAIAFGAYPGVAQSVRKSLQGNRLRLMRPYMEGNPPMFPSLPSYPEPAKCVRGAVRIDKRARERACACHFLEMG